MYLTFILDYLSITLKTISSTAVTIPPYALLVITLILLLYFIFYPSTPLTPPKTKPTHSPTSQAYISLKKKNFPPPFPNGWYHICNITDIAESAVHSVSALGLNIVVFRQQNEAKKAVALEAHCPHLGAHLGKGGVVVGSSIRCPFHEIEFDGVSGQSTRIPYGINMKDKSNDNNNNKFIKGHIGVTGEDVPKRCKTKAYHVREQAGLIMLWFDAEGRDPLYECTEYEDISVLDGGKALILRKVKQSTFNMHLVEMSENGADAVHFQTLHGPLPITGIEKYIGCVHTITQDYPDKTNLDGAKDEDGNQFTGKDRYWVAYFSEGSFQGLMNSLRMKDMFVNDGKIKLRNFVPFMGIFLDAVLTEVTFEGPGLISTKFTCGSLFTLRMLMTQLPVSPFVVNVENHWFAAWWVPSFVVAVFAEISAHALEQDRQVWENKVFRKKMMLVPGDGPFPAHRRWWTGHYSESSEKAGKRGDESLEW